jgi:hypothetical protein
MWNEFDDELDTAVEFDDIINETDLAILFLINGQEIWIPKSVITRQDDGEIFVQTWFARKEGLE